MLLTFVVDVTLTLNGQSAEYWLGNTIRVEEANPIAYILLVQSPQVVSVGYGGIVYLVIASQVSRWCWRRGGWVK